MSFPLAVVEIGGAALLIVGVFILTFLLVCVVAYWLLKGVAVSRDGKSRPVTFQFETSRELPVSKETFDSIVSAAQTALKKPEIPAAQRAFFKDVDKARAAFVSIYRIIMIAVGLVGLTASILMFRQATTANLMTLPAALIGLFSLGALGKGLLPDRRFQPVEPIDPALLDKIRDKISVRTSVEPLTINLGQFEMMKAADMLQRGASAEDVARAVYPTYDALQPFEKAAVQQMIAKAVKAYPQQKP
jgi:hypothetical protein